MDEKAETKEDKVSELVEAKAKPEIAEEAKPSDNKITVVEEAAVIFDAAGVYKSDTQLIEEAISRQVFSSSEKKDSQVAA